MKFVIAWFAAAIIFVGLDAIWLSQIAPRFTRPIIGELLAPGVQPVPAMLFYVIYLAGLIVLAVLPATSALQAFMRGAVLGLVAYATYDLTNQATLKIWSTALSLADIAWGTVISALAAAGAYAVVNWAQHHNWFKA